MLFRMRLMNNDEKHLDNPLAIRRIKNLSFESLVNKIKNRFTGWKIPFLLKREEVPLSNQWLWPSLFRTCHLFTSQTKSRKPLIKCVQPSGGARMRVRKKVPHDQVGRVI